MDRIQVEVAANMIEENLSNKCFGVAQLAMALNVSESNLRESFLRFLGERPHHLMRRLRMEKACDALRRGEPVSAVWQKVGYGSPRSFRYAFKRVYGSCPGIFKPSIVEKTSQRCVSAHPVPNEDTRERIVAEQPTK